MTMATLVKEKIYLDLASSSEFHHGRKQAACRQDTVLEKDLRVLTSDSQVTGSVLSHWAWLEHL